eukprot:symbB.v1.2.035376.t2/scaffold4747.1/size35473/3
MIKEATQAQTEELVTINKQLVAISDKINSFETQINSFKTTSEQAKCYINIADVDAEAAAQGNADVLKDVRLYEPNPESPPVAQTASRRQWNFLIDVVKEHMSQQDAALKAQDRKDRQKSQSDSGAGHSTRGNRLR